MIARIREWFRFDVETLAVAVSGLSAFSGAPLLLPHDLLIEPERSQEATDTDSGTTVRSQAHVHRTCR